MDHKDMKPTPSIVREMIDRVIKRMRYRKKVRADVRAELEGHFEDALAECQSEQEQMETAQRLVDKFGDTRLLAQLIRRAKKRCRPLWVKVMIHTFQVVGVCVLYFVLCVSRLFIGGPTIKMDLVDRVNATVQQGHDESQNAWPGIERAISLLKPQPKGLSDRSWYHDINDIQRQALERYVQENTPAYEVGGRDCYCLTFRIVSRPKPISIPFLRI